MKPSNQVWRLLGRLFVTACGIALCVPLLEWCFDSHATFQYLAYEYFFSLAYAVFIGAILSTAIPVVWKRSCEWPLAVRLPARLLTVLAGDAVGCLIAGLLPWAVIGARYEFWRSYVGSFKISLVLSGVALAFLITYDRLRAKLQVSEMELKNKELERQRALKLATDARLSSLESRIHPHFLFNTINSVSSLIPDDPQRAERILMQMANLLRFSLDSAQSGLVPLDREVKIIEDYLDIERARFDERLQFQIDVPDDLRFARVPPLALQTLAENAVKYAVSTRRQGATIRISASSEGERLILNVSDDGPGFAAIELPTGHGLHNLQERLAVVFGERARLDIESTAGGTTVTITMPLVGAAPGAAATESGERIALGA